MNLTTLAVYAVRAYRRAVFFGKSFGGVQSVGARFVVGPGVRIARGAELRFGDRVSIGADMTVHTHLDIGDDVMISSSVAFIGNDHDFSDPTKTIQEQARLPRARIVLEGDNLIGFGATLLGSVTVGHGSIVGAGSLVLHDVPSNSVCVGRPAVVVGKRR